MKIRQYTLIMIALVGGTMLLAGCGNLQSTPALMQKSVVERTVAAQGLAKVQSAIDSLSSIQNYQVKAQIQETTGKNDRSMNFYGTIILPTSAVPVQIQMDETIGGNNYPLYQNGSFAYYEDGNRWKPMNPVTDLRPWQSLADVIAKKPPKVVYQLPDQTAVSWLCHVYQFKTVDLGSFIGGTRLIKPQESLYTVWVDATDGLLRQIEVQSTVGIPDKGTEAMTSTELFFNYNSPNAIIGVPSGLVAQIEKP